MQLFDSHCHLDDKQYNRDFKGVLKRAAIAGVKCMLTVGVSHKSSSQAVALAESNPGVYASVGVHPHDAGYCGTATLDFLIKLAEVRRQDPAELADIIWENTCQLYGIN